MQELINKIKQQEKIKIEKKGDYRVLKVKENYFLFQIKKIATGLLMDFGSGGERLEPLLLLENYVDLKEAESFQGWEISENLELKYVLSKLDHQEMDFVDEGNSAEMIPLRVWSSKLPIMDFMLDTHYGPLHEEMVRRIKELYPNQEGIRILEVGCTKGRLMQEIKENCPGVSLFGLDLNKECADFCRGEGFDARFGDGEKIGEVFSERFDLIIGCGMLTEMIVGKEKALAIARSMYDCLNPGSHALVAGYRSVLLNKKDFERMGFKVLRTCLPENFFNEKMPKEFYVLKK